MKKNKLLTVIGAVLVICIVGFMVLKNAENDAADGELHIGAILALTGQSAFLGTETKLGIEAATDMLKEEGLVIKVHYEDSENLGKKGVSAFQKLSSNRKIRGLIVAHSGVAGPIADFISASPKSQINSYPLPICTMVSTDKVTENNDVMVRCFLDAKDEFQSILKYAKETVNPRKVGVIYQNDDLGLEGKKQFDKSFPAGASSQVVISESFDRSVANTRNIVTKALEAGAEVLLVVGNTPTYATIIRQLKESKFSGLIITGSTFEVASLRQAVGGDAIDGIVYVSAFHETEDMAACGDYAKLRAKIVEKGGSPNMLNVYSATACILLSRVINNNANTQPVVELSRKFENVQLDSPLGKVKFDSKRNVRAPSFIKRAKSVDAKADEFLAESR